MMRMIEAQRGVKAGPKDGVKVRDGDRDEVKKKWGFSGMGLRCGKGQREGEDLRWLVFLEGRTWVNKY